jgi:predicted O-linked N-acetylglucosamine transferase (SPINDLY family)
MSSDPLQLAREQHRQGRFAEAIAGYATFLERNPGRGDVWHLRAVAEHQQGQIDASWNSISQALATAGEQPQTLLLAGMVLQDRGDLPGAEQRFARAAALQPAWAPPLANRGQVLLDLGRAAEALETLRAAADLDKANPRIWNNIGLALVSLNRIPEAENAFNHSLTINPSQAVAHFNLARIHDLRGAPDRALQAAQTATQLDPRLTEAHLLLGDLFRKKRDAKGMEAALSAAMRLAPRNPRVRNAYAEFLATVGRPAEARDLFRVIARDNPANFKAALGANLTLPQVYRGSDELERWRAEYAQGLEHLAAGVAGYRFRSAREAMMQASWSNFYLAYQGRDDRALQVAYGDTLTRVVQPYLAALLPPLKPRPERARIRVGFASHFFFNCTAGRYFSSWITRLDPARFETFVYYTNEWVADDTRAIAAAATRFEHLPGRTPDVLAQQIWHDQLDVLVYPELGMHGDTFALAALRLAPVQVAGWGHPTTTGLPSIDYFLSSEAMEPEGAQAHYRERLVALPGLGTHYAAPAAPPAAERAAFGLPADETLFLVPQSLFKIHPDNDRLIARVIAADPKAALVFFAAPYEGITQVFGERLAAAFAAEGIETEARAIVLPYMSHEDYLRVNRSCDVMLDTLHWSGGNTSLDALACGLPVVTLPGALMRGRQSSAMLRLLGVDELIARDLDDYVAIASRLGKDADLRASLSQRISAASPTLFSRDEPIRALEDFLQRAHANRGQTPFPA